MDFFDMNFSTLFLERHGKLIYDKIEKQIIEENSSHYDENYIEIIFKIAFLDFFGLTLNEIKKMIEDIMLGQQVNIENLSSIHKKSIFAIQKYLKEATKKASNDNSRY